MRKILSWIVLLPLIAVLVSFSLSNRDALVLRLWPTDLEVTAPAFIVGLAGIFVGFLWGAAALWLSGGEARRRARQNARAAGEREREVTRLKRDIQALEDKLKSQSDAPPAATLPAVTAGPPQSQPRII
ncbi:MAG: hypothetical protein VW268_06765 [Rhodospirillaceae bacterium]